MIHKNKTINIFTFCCFILFGTSWLLSCKWTFIKRAGLKGRSRWRCWKGTPVKRTGRKWRSRRNGQVGTSIKRAGLKGRSRRRCWKGTPIKRTGLKWRSRRNGQKGTSIKWASLKGRSGDLLLTSTIRALSVFFFHCQDNIFFYCGSRNFSLKFIMHIMYLLLLATLTSRQWQEDKHYTKNDAVLPSSLGKSMARFSTHGLWGAIKQ